MSRVRTMDAEARWVVASILLTAAGVALAAVLAAPIVMGMTAVVAIMLLIVAWRIYQSPKLAWLLGFGLVVGVLELWADWLHVEHLHSLVYDDVAGLRLLASPWYMPIGWWLTSVQFGYLALWLVEHWSQARVVVAITLLGMTLPPWYEELAAPAQAWHYTTEGVQLSHTPVWVILTYGGVMFAIATMVLAFYCPNCWGRAVLSGIFTAAGIMLSSVVWFSLLG